MASKQDNSPARIDAAAETDDTAGETVQVLEFELGTETYCVDIDYVAEIVDVGDLTIIPNTPDHVEGVMDLRGETTSIVNPKTVFDIAADGDRKRIIVFDSEQLDGGATGWLVDEVYQVVRVEEGDVDPAPVDDSDAIHGVVKRERGFVIWADPESVHSG